MNGYLQSMIQDELDWLAGLPMRRPFVPADARNQWAGLFIQGGEQLGPFQGNPAASALHSLGLRPLQRPGKCKLFRMSTCVPGHAARDSESQSEIVLPVSATKADRGVDIDSPVKSRSDRKMPTDWHSSSISCINS